MKRIHLIALTCILAGTAGTARAGQMDCVDFVGDCSLDRSELVKRYPDQPISVVTWSAEAGFAVRYRGEIEHVVYETSYHESRHFEEDESCRKAGLFHREECHRWVSEDEDSEYHRIPHEWIEQVAGGFESTLSSQDDDSTVAESQAMAECQKERRRMIELFPACGDSLKREGYDTQHP